MPIEITSFYRFQNLSKDQVEKLRLRLEALPAQHDLRGLCLLGHEGINATFSGSKYAIAALREVVNSVFVDVFFKDSHSDRHPFQEFTIKVKNEIVTMGRPGLTPTSREAHLSPAEWHQAMQDPDVVVLDTRNDYEIDIGKFSGAVDFRLKEFRDFPEAVRTSGIPKDKKVLMYCTGGIRCEKAYLEMREQGYTDVKQLDGGILNYLERFPEQKFEGECFVFDYRVAVDQKLNASKRYKLCPHCGGPAAEPVACTLCKTETQICHACSKAGIKACSKNCAHHLAIGSNSTRPPQPRPR